VQRRLAALSALVAAASIAAGAFGAHGLARRLGADELALWETGARYLAYGGLGGLAIAALVAASDRSRGAVAGFVVVAGALLFALTLFILALGGPRWVGAVTPLGGAAMLVGFGLFAIAVLARGGS